MITQNLQISREILEKTELFFETRSYRIQDICEDLKVTTQEFLDLVRKTIRVELPLFDVIDKTTRKQITRTIHEKMVENNILSREMKILLTLHEYYENENSVFYYTNADDDCFKVDKNELIKILFPNERLRQEEVYSYVVEFIERHNSQIEVTNFTKHPVDICEKLGFYIDGNEEMDRIYDLLAEKQFFGCSEIQAQSISMTTGIINLIIDQLKLLSDFDPRDELIRELQNYYQHSPIF